MIQKSWTTLKTIPPRSAEINDLRRRIRINVPFCFSIPQICTFWAFHPIYLPRITNGGPNNPDKVQMAELTEKEKEITAGERASALNQWLNDHWHLLPGSLIVVVGLSAAVENVGLSALVEVFSAWF